MSILLYRNYFFPGTNGNTALAHFLPVVISSAVGYGAAAWLTPVATSRMSNAAWVTAMLAAGGVVTGTLGLTFSQPEYVAIGFILGVVAQGIAISTTTILQQDTADEFRGRVFSVNDMLYNTSFVIGAAACAGFLPDVRPLGRDAGDRRRRLPGRSGRRTGSSAVRNRCQSPCPAQQFLDRAVVIQRAVIQPQVEQVLVGLADGRARADAEHLHDLVAVQVGPDLG